MCGRELRYNSLKFIEVLSSGQIDVCEETAAATNAAGEEEMYISDDDEFQTRPAEPRGGAESGLWYSRR